MIPQPGVAKAQQEAAARVQAMEERSRRLVREHPVNVYRGVTVGTPVVTPAAEPPCDPVCETPVSPCETPPAACENSRCLSLFGGDNERLFLLLLAAVLLKNGAPIQLLLALLYVAL